MNDSTDGLARRRVLEGAALIGLAAPVLAACGSGSSSQDSSGSGSSSGDGSVKAGADLVATADVPVGGGVILTEQKLVVTQPDKGDFKAFTAVCTHQGCLVGKVEGGKIVCPCHGSEYSVDDGSVVGGPAPKPLAAVKVTVKGSEVVAG